MMYNVLYPIEGILHAFHARLLYILSILSISRSLLMFYLLSFIDVVSQSAISS